MSLYKFQSLYGDNKTAKVLRDPGAPTGSNLQKAAENLLVHIPGEASGFYLLSIANFAAPTNLEYIILFVFSIVILLLIRILAKASVSVIVSSLFAFIIWMFIFEHGALRNLLPTIYSLISLPMWLVIAGFFSTIVTILATAGKLK